MQIHFHGGIQDGLVLDLDDPAATPSWQMPTLPAPEVLQLHVVRSCRTVYRLSSATPDDAVFRLDAELTAAARASR